MCHSFRRGTMQMYQIREANSGGKSKKVVVYIIQKGLNHYIPIIYKIIFNYQLPKNGRTYSRTVRLVHFPFKVGLVATVLLVFVGFNFFCF